MQLRNLITNEDMPPFPTPEGEMSHFGRFTSGTGNFCLHTTTKQLEGTGMINGLPRLRAFTQASPDPFGVETLIIVGLKRESQI